jgi:phosphotriesterase-related protein
MPFVRTVLGDVDPADLGVVYAHEHLVIAGGRPVEREPDFLLADVERAVAELAPAVALGLRTVVDAMPCDAGRDVRLLAEISRRAQIHVVAPTGLHHERYYEDRHWSRTYEVEEIADLFAADIEDGIDERDYAGPLVRRTPHRAGVIKIAGSEGGLSARDERIFDAAAIAHRRTGCPILTHCENGTGALEQIRRLVDGGVEPGHIVCSHVDKVVDRGYQRAIFATGACVEYDQAFRWPADGPNGTLTCIEWAIEDGFADRIVLGLDAARRRYWAAYGGRPGWTYLLGPFAALLAERGVPEPVRRAFFVENPARAYTFAPAARTA